MLFPSFFNAAKPTYEIEQSLRFKSGNSNLRKAFSSAGDEQTWTLSVWIKYPICSANHAVILSAGPQGSYDNIRISTTGHTPNNAFSWYADGKGYQRSTRKARDPGAWYHWVCVWDTNNSTALDRRIMYVNGERITDFYSNSNPSSGASSMINGARTMHIGELVDYGTASENLQGYLAEYHFVDGSALQPTDFGEYDESGVWRPIEYTGSYGSNGWYLKFDPTAANGLGHDHSGNGNHFTATGFTTSGTGTDVMSDTPTKNFCTVNPLSQRQYVTFSEGNLRLNWNNSGNGTSAAATMGLTSGKYYWETTITSGSSVDRVGAISPDVNLMGSAGAFYFDQRTYSWSYRADGFTVNNNVSTNQSTTYTTGDVIGVAVDMDAGKIWFSKNGTFLNSGDPAAGTNAVYSTVTGTIIPAWSGFGQGGSTRAMTCNFGQRDFAYTPPTGFKSLNTANLPAPTIKDGSDYFNTVLWTGNATNRSITGVGFQPDLVWTKGRSSPYSNNLLDVIRGATNFLQSNNSDAEATLSTLLTSFDSDGFSLGTSAGVNNNGTTYVAWNWLGGGSGSSNTDGSITSTVSANATAGFSIVTYTGTGANATVGHGLGVGVDFILIKSRSNASSWQAGHSGAGWTKYGHLDLSNTFASASTVWQDTAPTSTVFSLGTETGVNGLNRTYVAYCFAEVEGYSKFGSYTGNGNADGPFVYCGFRPAWIMVKNTTTAQGWYISDNKRDTYNQVNRALFASSNSAESSATTGASYDFLSNGFKPRTSNNDSNGSNDVYIFMAFSENPFGGSGVSPATAR